MSTSMIIDGRIDIEPSIPLGMLPADSPHNPANHQGRPANNPVDLVFDVETNPVTGQQFVTGLVPAVTFGRKLGSPYAEIMDLIAEYGLGCAFSGTLGVADDEGGTSEIVVKDGSVEWSDWIYPDDE
ncbi:hypothetical protein ABZ897_15980 [Nonomuraea sp. NPDC046802]|uniref:hypothetical protein n=1 Tax=Nonomuraea sp. NPDC046802 TaxID=3154919 RepID=UPI0033CFBDD6